MIGPYVDVATEYCYYYREDSLIKTQHESPIRRNQNLMGLKVHSHLKVHLLLLSSSSRAQVTVSAPGFRHASDE